MKTKFTALAAAALFFAAPVTAFADDYEPYENSSRAGHVELYAGYGTPSVIPYFVEIFAGLFGALGGVEKMEDQNMGVIQGGVNYYMTDWFLLGLYGSYEQFGIKFDDNDRTDCRIGTLQAKTQFEYGFNHVKFYHVLNAGVALIDGQDSEPGFIFGVVPLGLKVSCTDNLSVFAELGFVSNSFVAGGITYRF